MSEATESVPQQDRVGRLRSAIRRAAEHAVTPGHVSKTLMDSFDRVAVIQPDMNRIRGICKIASKAAGIGAFTADIAISAVAAYGSAARGIELRKYRQTHSPESLTANLIKNVNLANVFKMRFKFPEETPIKDIALKAWNIDQRSRLAGIAKFGGVSAAVLAGQPVARATELAARAAGSIGERVARRMQQIKIGVLTNHSHSFHTGSI